MKARGNAQSGLLKDIVAIDESMREIAALDDLYSEIISSGANDARDLSVKKEEAMFARERVLKLSLHVKNLLGEIEPEEKLK
jgi:hypothetical protein